jgi:hypothetical protein
VLDLSVGPDERALAIGLDRVRLPASASSSRREQTRPRGFSASIIGRMSGS